MESLKLYSDVRASKVNWLWYPYIPSGKITLLQGDPGDGKSTMVMNIISILTNAENMPNGQKVETPKKVIYQCSEDDVADTIKPRLEKCGADCTRVAFVNEELSDISLENDILRDAIKEFQADLLVIDPIQAYLGQDANLSNTKAIRKIMQKLSIWASTCNCAILLIGHMTKNEGSKDLYRGMGTIDLVASARSVLQVYKNDETGNVRRVRQIKNSLAPKGEDISYELNPEKGFQWIDQHYKNYVEDAAVIPNDTSQTRDERIADMLIRKLINGPVNAVEIQEYFIAEGISLKTLKRIKKIAGIKSVRSKGRWYWEITEAQNERPEMEETHGQDKSGRLCKTGKVVGTVAGCSSFLSPELLSGNVR